MNIFKIENEIITYKNIEMKKVKDFRFNNNDYIEFVNNKEHKYIVMEKISEDKCIEIKDKEYLNIIIKNNLKIKKDYLE